MLPALLQSRPSTKEVTDTTQKGFDDDVLHSRPLDALDCWDFALRPSSEHNISESAVRGEEPTQLGPLRRANLDH
jgi:hypothetical protein